MRIAWFSTDWQGERIVDRLASARQGRTIIDPHNRQMVFGGTYYYRMALPGLELAKHGFDAVLSPGVQSAPDGHIRVFDIATQEWRDDCDVIVFQRWMHRDGSAMANRARACGQKVVQDVDDHFWALPKTNIAHKTTDAKTNPDFNRDHYKRMILASDLVICSTPPIASYLGGRVPAVVCRNSIDIDRWKPRDADKDGMVGWVGGIAWRGNDLPLLRGVLGPFLEEHGLPFYHGGHSDDPGVPTAWEQLGLSRSTRILASPIVKISDYPKLWEPISLAVIPLEDCTFNRSKSWLKGLEAAASGIPFVASRLPEYEALGAGRLAKTRGEWRAHLDALLDPDVRRAEGAANRARAEGLAIDRQWPQWADAFAQIGIAPELVAA